MDFKVVGGINGVPTVLAPIASATVIEPGDLVSISSGLVVKAAANSTVLAYCPNGSAAGETQTEVTVGNDFVLEGTADANFAAANRGAEVDLVVTNNVQLIDLGESTTDVFKVSIGVDAGTVGSKNNVRVRINKPAF